MSKLIHPDKTRGLPARAKYVTDSLHAAFEFIRITYSESSSQANASRTTPPIATDYPLYGSAEFIIRADLSAPEANFSQPDANGPIILNQLAGGPWDGRADSQDQDQNQDQHQDHQAADDAPDDPRGLDGPYAAIDPSIRGIDGCLPDDYGAMDAVEMQWVMVSPFLISMPYL